MSAVKNVGEVVEDPQIAARDMVVDVEYPDFGELRMFGSPIKLDVTPTDPRGLAPKVGEHTDLLLRAFADLTDAQISDLRAAGAI
ncbi:MAG: CoA transferase [Pseudonocardia sp.]|nr:CoA transferase [Pseudonocardia sp.]